LEHDLFGKPVSTFPDHALTPHAGITDVTDTIWRDAGVADSAHGNRAAIITDAGHANRRDGPHDGRNDDRLGADHATLRHVSGLAMHRSITAAVMRRYMRPNSAQQNPTNMGVRQKRSGGVD